MTTWFTSDTHFGHTNVIQYSNRPFSTVEEMDEALVSNWNRVVAPGDTVYHLGDVGLGSQSNTLAILERLNGHLYLIHGNHDHGCGRVRNWSGWIKSVPALEIKVHGTYIYLHHYACRVWSRSHYGSWHLYGHSHGELPGVGRSLDVGVDSKVITSEYRPVSYEEIHAYMETVG